MLLAGSPGIAPSLPGTHNNVIQEQRDPALTEQALGEQAQGVLQGRASPPSEEVATAGLLWLPRQQRESSASSGKEQGKKQKPICCSRMQPGAIQQQLGHPWEGWSRHPGARNAAQAQVNHSCAGVQALSSEQGLRQGIALPPGSQPSASTLPHAHLAWD